MLKLMTDSGNNYTKFSIFEDKQIIQTFSEKTEKVNSKTIERILKNGIRPDKVFLSSVNLHEKRISKFLKENGLKVYRRNDVKEFPVSINYLKSSGLGFDRIAAACGAVFLYPETDILVIDAGTALTIDIVSRNKVFEGGTISPGLGIRFQSLHNNTGRLPLVKPDIKYPITGTSTEECINSGCLHGMIFEIQGFVSFYKKKYRKLKIIMTGGDTEILHLPFKNTIFAEPNLVHIGLNEIFDYHISRN